MFKNKPGYMTMPKERISYGVYFTGQNMFYHLINAFLASYLLFLGIEPGKTALVMLIVKIWDAVNDVFFATIFDKIKFKKGKALPWLRISSPLITATTILLFAIPNSMGDTQKLLWFAAAYLLWDTAYTLCDVPVYTLVTTMTNNLDERNVLMSARSILGGVGAGITTVLVTAFTSQNIGLGWFPTGIIISLMGFVFMIPILINIKEHNYNEALEAEQHFTMKQMLIYVTKNKYLLLYYLSFLLSQGLLTTNALNLFVSYYLFGNEWFSIVIGAASMALSFFVPFIMPQLLRKIDKFKLYFWCAVVSTFLAFAIFFAGYASPWLFLVLTALRSLPLGVTGTMMFMFTPDHAEYGQYKTGIEAKGITFAIQTFSAKLQGAIASSLALALLAIPAFKWVNIKAESFKHLQELNIQQPQEALNGLWIIYALVPAIGMLLSLIPLLFYKLNDKDVQVMAKCNSGEITHDEAEAMLSRKY